jgi:hypothetical protein
VLDHAGLAMHELAGADHLAAKSSAHGLMPKANPQDR